MFNKKWTKERWQEMADSFMSEYPPDKLFSSHRNAPQMRIKIYEYMLWMRAVEALEKIANKKK